MSLVYQIGEVITIGCKSDHYISLKGANGPSSIDSHAAKMDEHHNRSYESSCGPDGWNPPLFTCTKLDCRSVRAAPKEVLLDAEVTRAVKILEREAILMDYLRFCGGERL